MKVDAVLFDLDGVLVDACDWHYHALNDALLDAGHSQITKSDHISKYNGLPTRVKLKMLGISDNDAERINATKQQYTLSAIKKNAKLMAEKVELHSYLKKKGIKIACVTNSIKETAEEMLRSTGQIDYIDLLVTNEMVVNNKPSPDCYDLAVEELKVDPRLCICVEDSPKGILAARSSRISNLWIVPNPSHVNVSNFKVFIEEEMS
jgi:HAD superfamily hydrolase (TIGR01509 family)